MSKLKFLQMDTLKQIFEYKIKTYEIQFVLVHRCVKDDSD